MDKKTRKAIRNKIICKVWAEMKNEITMKDLADVLDIPLATFYRVIKSGIQSEAEVQGNTGEDLKENPSK